MWTVSVYKADSEAKSGRKKAGSFNVNTPDPIEAMDSAKDALSKFSSEKRKAIARLVLEVPKSKDEGASIDL